MISVDQLLKFAVKNGASDIHISAGMPPVIRINGRLIQVEGDKLMPPDTELMARSVMSDEIYKKFLEYGEVDFSYSVPDAGRFRINIYNQRNSISIAMRSVPLRVPSIEELGLPSVLKKIAEMKRGLVLVTGPTGSGKTTTLAGMVDHINKTRRSHVITLEDPIEYLHRHNKSIVNQREIGTDSINYHNALRASLRQDPDVLLIGEMRDLETISTAITAAETGHLVLSTLHTTGAVATVDRIVDVFPHNQQEQIRVQLSNVLQAVISQQLINRIDKNGRIAALEILICNTAVRNHIREGKTHQIMSTIQTGKKAGMIAMDAFIVDLYNRGIISYEDALSFSIDREFLIKML